MKRGIGVVIIIALVGGGAYWLFRQAATSSGGQQQHPQQSGDPGGPPGYGGQPSSPGAAATGSKIVGLGPGGQAPDERHPRHHTAQQLRVDPVRAAGRRAELLQQIRKGREVPGSADDSSSAGDKDKAVLSKEQIQAAIKAVTPLMTACYEKRLAQKKDLAGKAVVKFTIVAKEGQGSLDEGEIKSSTLGDLRLDTCLLNAMTKARFPLPQGEGKVTVNYPFIFRPSKE